MGVNSLSHPSSHPVGENSPRGWEIPPWVGNPFPTLLDTPCVCELPPWVGNPFPTPLDTLRVCELPPWV